MKVETPVRNDVSALVDPPENLSHQLMEILK